MYIYNNFLFKKGDEVICPSCRKNVFAKDDVPISEEKRLVMCPKCRAYVRWGNCRKVDKSEVEE